MPKEEEEGEEEKEKKKKRRKTKQSRKWETPVVKLETNVGHLEKIHQERDLGVEVPKLQLINTTVVSKAVGVNVGSGSQRGSERERESGRERGR